MEYGHLNLVFGWFWMLGGLIAGAIIGLFFYKEQWMGGYTAFRRRLVRLGHIAFFGLGFINLLFALSVPQLTLTAMQHAIASIGLIVGAATMPACCFLTAWKPAFRHLFPIPVLSTATAIVIILIGTRLS